MHILVPLACLGYLCFLAMASESGFWNGTHPRLPTPSSLLELFSTPDLDTAYNLLRQAQCPVNCTHARLLIATEVSLNAGFGWHFW